MHTLSAFTAFLIMSLKNVIILFQIPFCDIRDISSLPDCFFTIPLLGNVVRIIWYIKCNISLLFPSAAVFTDINHFTCVNSSIRSAVI